jgi:hypothetical protein
MNPDAKIQGLSSLPPQLSLLAAARLGLHQSQFRRKTPA